MVDDFHEVAVSVKGQTWPSSTASRIVADTVSLERHICLFFVNQDEQWQMMRPYLLEHLGTGVPVLYIQDSTPPERLLELMRAEELPVEDLIARGLLRIIPPEQAYMITRRLDAHPSLLFLKTAVPA